MEIGTKLDIEDFFFMKDTVTIEVLMMPLTTLTQTYLFQIPGYSIKTHHVSLGMPALTGRTLDEIVKDHIMDFMNKQLESLNSAVKQDPEYTDEDELFKMPKTISFTFKDRI
jgi:hypothetical protein